MLTYLEHVGLVSIFEKEIAACRNEKDRHEKNAAMKEQSQEYRNNHAIQAECFKARLISLHWSLEQVNRIKHEYA